MVQGNFKMKKSQKNMYSYVSLASHILGVTSNVTLQQDIWNTKWLFKNHKGS